MSGIKAKTAEIAFASIPLEASESGTTPRDKIAVYEAVFDRADPHSAYIIYNSPSFCRGGLAFGLKVVAN